MKLADMKCGVYLGVILPDEALHDRLLFAEPVYSLIFRKTTSIYDLELFNTFAAVCYHPKKVWVRLRQEVEMNLRMECGSLHLIWDFEPSLNKVNGAPPLAYLEMLESIVGNHLTAFLKRANDATVARDSPQYKLALAPFHTDEAGKQVEASPLALITGALRAGFEGIGLARPVGRQRAQNVRSGAAPPVLAARAQPAAPAPRTLEALLAWVRERMLSLASLDGMHLPGFTGSNPAEIAPPGGSAAGARAVFRAFRLNIPRIRQGQQSDEKPVYGAELALAAKKHKSLTKDTTEKENKKNPKKKQTTTGSGDPSGFRGVLKGSDYVYASTYGFRADTRPPCDLMSLGGFQPNAIRKDRQDAIWKNKPPNDFEKVRMLDNFNHQAKWGSDVSGYISVAHSLPPALLFAELLTVADSMGREIPIPQRPPSYVYVVCARDGVDVAASFEQTRYNECEISVAGGIGWPDIIGWRRLSWRAAGAANPKGELYWSSDLFWVDDRETLPQDDLKKLEAVMSLSAAHVQRVDATK